MESSESELEPYSTTTTAAPADAMEEVDKEMQISDEVRELHDLAIRGSWTTILDKVSKARSLSLLRYPHDHLIFLTFNAISLTKLRRYSDALKDIENTVESLDSPSLRYESYPTLYPPYRKGSMVPFSLRWLQAILPSLLRSPTATTTTTTLDPLYLLLHFVRSHSTTSDLWMRRENLVMGTLVSLHSAHKDYPICLSLLTTMLDRDPDNPSLLSKLGYIQLQLGDLDGAKSSFNFAQNSSSDPNLVSRNKALLYLVAKDYVSAVREYEDCIERDPSDVVAINNKALCLMYLRDLSDSIKVLENSLERVPTVALNETIIINLCSMYELAFVNHIDLKKTLSNWIARVAPDDFDSSCTRI